MRKIVAVTLFVACLAFAGIVKAEEGGIYFKAGQLELTYPFATISAISLYDFWGGRGLVGAETRLAGWNAVNLNLGAVTSFEANGAPFVSVDFDFAKIISDAPAFLARFGGWVGRDFERGAYMAGVKAAVPLW